jgi:hypothetical protein
MYVVLVLSASNRLYAVGVHSRKGNEMNFYSPWAPKVPDQYGLLLRIIIITFRYRGNSVGKYSFG